MTRALNQSSASLQYIVARRDNGTLAHALDSFDEKPHSTVLRAHARARQWRAALLLFLRMLRHHRPDPFSLSIALKSSASVRNLNLGKVLHSLAVKTAPLDVFSGAALVQVYGKCGCMRDARRVFDEIPQPDVVLWTSVVSGFQQNGLAEEAVEFFSDMVVGRGLAPEAVTLVSIVSALGQLRDIRAGKSCHGCCIRMGFGSNLSLANSILNLYANLGVVNLAERLFDGMLERDVITWSCMIACHARNGNPSSALDAYRRMIAAGFEPNSVTMVSVLQACALASDLEEGKRAHKLAVRKGFELDLGVSTAIMDMYIKCARHNEAMNIFHRIPKKDAVAWAVLISGCAQNGLTNESLEVFRRMLDYGTSPDAVTMVKVLNAASCSGNLCQALCLHGYLVSSGFDSKVFVSAALIDLYSKSGSLADAVQVFESVNKKDVVIWCSMIAGYGMHGRGGDAVALFDRMIECSIEPNGVVFVAVLSACSHSGLVEEGRRIFHSMSCVYGVLPDSEHWSIMVDLLGRTGRLQEALELVQQSPSLVSPDAWCALLAGCRLHQETKMAEFVAKALLELKPDHAGYYNLLSNVYASDERWDQVIKVKSVIMEKGLRKTPGYSSVQIGSHTMDRI